MVQESRGRLQVVQRADQVNFDLLYGKCEVEIDQDCNLALITDREALSIDSLLSKCNPADSSDGTPTPADDTLEEFKKKPKRSLYSIITISQTFNENDFEDRRCNYPLTDGCRKNDKICQGSDSGNGSRRLSEG